MLLSLAMKLLNVFSRFNSGIPLPLNSFDLTNVIARVGNIMIEQLAHRCNLAFVIDCGAFPIIRLQSCEKLSVILSESEKYVQ